MHTGIPCGTSADSPFTVCRLYVGSDVQRLEIERSSFARSEENFLPREIKLVITVNIAAGIVPSELQKPSRAGYIKVL